MEDIKVNVLSSMFIKITGECGDANMINNAGEFVGASDHGDFWYD